MRGTVAFSVSRWWIRDDDLTRRSERGSVEPSGLRLLQLSPTLLVSIDISGIQPLTSSKLQFRSRGDKALSSAVADALGKAGVHYDIVPSRGLNHGVWSERTTVSTLTSN